MEKYFYEECCPKCGKETLDIHKSNYHHVERCNNCDYEYEEYSIGYEHYLYRKNVNLGA